MRALTLLVLLSACGSSSSSSTAATEPSPSDPLKSGTCGFTLDGAAHSLQGYADMNGSGNLEVRCAGGAVTFALDVGNATYEGPGTYTFSTDLHHGALSIDFGTTVYEEGQCTVTIASAPIASYAPKGSTITGTLVCPKMLRYAKDDDGTRASESSAETTLSNGSFSVIVQ